MHIDINELEILAPDDAGPAAKPAAEDTPRPPAADLDERLRAWHREARTRDHRLQAD